uniref:Uncharacterized protein isoform X2 n=1 Tax=Nicotiana tabacum TaxID=4097 RepID=A0A1S3ZWS5_TOBAC|nr:PREDICTED: uncharacterized protein LOC107791321 isoform X2 [Nicotiana tabacum]
MEIGSARMKSIHWVMIMRSTIYRNMECIVQQTLSVNDLLSRWNVFLMGRPIIAAMAVFLLAHLDDPVVLYTYREQNQVLTFERPLCATQGMGTNSSSFSKDPLLSRPILRSPP